MNSTAVSSKQTNCLQLKGSLLPLTVLELSYFEPSQFSAELSAKKEQAPDFFTNLPVVIGLTKFDGAKGPADFEKIIRICSTFSIKPIAISGGSETQQIAAKLAGLATMPAQKDKTTPPAKEQTDLHAVEDIPVDNQSNSHQPNRSKDANSTSQPTENSQQTDTPPATEIRTQETRVIYQPVRSGQQVYAQNGDLIVLAQVSAGAEILADGNIHVYGPLRGRALAGVKGNTSARIFCHSLEAELVSIAGQYKISEDLQNGHWKKPAQIHLSDESLAVKALID